MKKYDAIVIGSGISGGWAAKELTEKGLKVLLLERGRNIEHVKDYDTHEQIRAEKAHYVIHSNIEGLNGDELVPFSDRASAEAFTKEHGGKTLLFKDITPEIVNSLKNIVSDKSPTIQ